MVKPSIDLPDRIPPSDGSAGKCQIPPIPYPHPACLNFLSKVGEKYVDPGDRLIVDSCVYLSVALPRTF